MAVTHSAPGNRFHQVYQAFSEGELVVTSESTKTFSRMFRGYNPAAVDTYIEVLTAKQQALLNDVESLKARLKEAGEERAVLRKEIATLTDSSPSPHAMQHRMAKMMRRAVDEVSEMQAESRAEADALIAAAEAEVEAAQRKHRELVADMATQRKALEADFKDSKKKLEVELGRMRAETQSAIDELWREAQQEREQLIADAKLEAGHYREQAQRAVDEASQQRIHVLERLMSVYSDLQAIPATLEMAYQERRNTPDGTVVPLGQKISAG
jgi:cell division septum initiation protein DivIVA